MGGRLIRDSVRKTPITAIGQEVRLRRSEALSNKSHRLPSTREQFELYRDLAEEMRAEYATEANEAAAEIEAELRAETAAEARAETEEYF